MCIKEKLSKVVFDEKAKSHIEERHIEEWGGKSRFIIPKEEVFDLVRSMIEDGNDGEGIDGIYYSGSSYTIILRKVLDRDIGVNMFDKKKMDNSIYVIIRDTRVVTAFPAAEERTHNGLLRIKEEKVYSEEVDEEGYYVEDEEEEEEEEEVDDDYEVNTRCFESKEEDRVYEELWL